MLGLTAQLTRNIPGNLLTAKDRTYLIDKPNDVGIAAVITDAKGKKSIYVDDIDSDFVEKAISELYKQINE